MNWPDDFINGDCFGLTLTADNIILLSCPKVNLKTPLVAQEIFLKRLSAVAILTVLNVARNFGESLMLLKKEIINSALRVVILIGKEERKKTFRIQPISAVKTILTGGVGSFPTTKDYEQARNMLNGEGLFLKGIIGYVKNVGNEARKMIILGWRLITLSRLLRFLNCVLKLRME